MDVMATHVVTTIRLDARENGPIGTANGGFACGTFAGLVGGTAEVRLEVPVPLGVDLEARIDGTGARVRFAGQTLAAPRATDPFVLTPPVRPGLDQAMRARLRHPFHGITHPLSGCEGAAPSGPTAWGSLPVRWTATTTSWPHRSCPPTRSPLTVGSGPRPSGVR